MSWTPQQQAMLSAMGYTLYRQAGADAALATGTVTGTQVESSPRPPPSDRLMQALLRAAGGRDPDALAIPPLDQLRGDPLAKRALWPRLRALRRQR